MLITALIVVLIICCSHDVTQGALRERIDRGPHWLSGPPGRQTCPLGWNRVRGWWRGPAVAETSEPEATDLGALGGHWALTDSSEGIIIPAVISRDWGLYKAKRKPAVLDKAGGQVTVCPLASVSLLVLGYPSKIVTMFSSLQM